MSGDIMNRGYDWTLVGPWYRMESVGGGKGRSKRPIIQKYATLDFVDGFLKEPQRSLKFTCADLVQHTCSGHILSPVGLADRQSGDRLKLFLDCHSRHYLVVCELHCKAPGFPSVSRDQVCEAGFVLRRWSMQMTPEAKRELQPLLAQKKRLELKRQQWTSKYPVKSSDSANPFVKIVQEAGSAARMKRLQKVDTEYQKIVAQIQKASAFHDIKQVQQKWVQSTDQKGMGSWATIQTGSEETPDVITEEILPLYPLVPDPAQADHSARGKTLWFGVIPTFSGDIDENGNAKFDNERTYAVRCYVRRHKPGCPKKLTRADCHGEIVWSDASESFTLASYFDLDGTVNKPVNILLPDLDQLKHQVLDRPVGTGLNVRMMPPPGSGLTFRNNGMDMPGGGARGNQICFNFVFLLTFVALFVFRLFLPIVVFVFGLWWMLRLRLCIPPSISLDLEFAADLAVYGPEFEVALETKMGIDASVQLGSETFSQSEAWKRKLKQKLIDELSLPGVEPTVVDDALNRMDFDEAAGTIVAMATEFSDDPQHEALAGRLPFPTDGLEYFEKVTPL